MAFRSIKYVEKTDYLRFNLSTPIILPANGQYQEKTGYIFNMTDRSSWFDWFNGYILVKYNLQKKADGSNIVVNDLKTTVITSTINDSTSIINHIMITSGGKKVYDGNDLHKISFVKGLLEFSDDYSRTLATNFNWYLDDREISGDMSTHPTVGVLKRAELVAQSKYVFALIPLNRFSIFQELNDKMIPPQQIELNITLNPDTEFIYRSKADETRYVIKEFQLWLPRLTFTAEGQKLVNSNFLKPSKWSYLREFIKHSAPTNAVSGIYQITPAIKSPKHVFVYFQRNKTNNELENPFIFDTYKINKADTNCTLSTARLQLGTSWFVPELEYDTNFKPRIYRDLQEYSNKPNDYDSGSQLQLENYSELYGLLYFDLRNYKEEVTADPKQILFHYRLNQQATDDYMIYAIVLYESSIVIDKIGNEIIVT